jgi:NADH-quinone oxidoreductase subunit M
LAHLQLISGDKVASKVALFFGISALGCSILLLNHFNENILIQWINQPNVSFALAADGLNAMLLLQALTPLSFTLLLRMNIKCESFYALILFMSLQWLNILAQMVFYIISSGNYLIPIYFIALIWGNGDAEERKSSGKILYLHLSRFLIYAYCFVYLYQQAGSFLIRDIN